MKCTVDDDRVFASKDLQNSQTVIKIIEHNSAVFASKDHHGASQIITTNKLNVPYNIKIVAHHELDTF
jgi:hypothetical protein